jgi:hypothetical protein
MSNEVYQQLVFGGFGPFFKNFRQVMKNGYFLLEKV